MSAAVPARVARSMERRDRWVGGAFGSGRMQVLLRLLVGNANWEFELQRPLKTCGVRVRFRRTEADGIDGAVSFSQAVTVRPALLFATGTRVFRSC